MNDLTIAMGQMTVVGGEPDHNLSVAKKMIAEAAKLGCDAVVLPECLDIGWTNPSAEVLAKPIPGPYSSIICKAAKQSRIHVVAGLTERDSGQLFNASILVSPEGEILLKHRKINELEVGAIYSRGDKLGVAHTEIGTIGITICADNFTDSICLGLALSQMGANLLLSPCSWAISSSKWANDVRGHPSNTGFHDMHAIRHSYQQLARSNRMVVIGVSNVGRVSSGPWEGRECIGSSMAIGRSGEVLSYAGYGENAEELVVVTVPRPK